MDKLFTQDLIDVDTMYLQVRNETYSRDEIIDIMRECNWIWKKRMKVKEIGWTEYTNIDRNIEESLRANRKIQAIKIYRKHKIDNGVDCSLKEAKEYIDKLQIKMGLDV
jgi:ribosomal protein L7/L12